MQLVLLRLVWAVSLPAALLPATPLGLRDPRQTGELRDHRQSGESSLLSVRTVVRTRGELDRRIELDAPERPEDLVEVLAGTDTASGGSNSNGNVLPQLKRPHGMNDWAPETNPGGQAWWFRRKDVRFHGMRCTHQPSPWIGDYGYFKVQPHIDPTGEGHAPKALRYSAGKSVFRPYYFSTNLTDSEQRLISMEVTASSRAALVRVSFGSEDQAGHVSVLGQDMVFADGALRGKATSVSHAAPKGWQGAFISVKPITPAKGGDAGSTHGTLEFAGTATLAIATSFISQEQADRNLEQEIGSLDSKTFDRMLEENRLAWNSLLGRVKVQALDEERSAVFYTNLWRSMLFPRNFHEYGADGEEIHFSPYTGKTEKGKLVADSGFWDSYRTVYTLKSVIAPDQLGKLVAGWVNAYQEAQWLPQWASPDQQNSMVGTMGDLVLADAIAKSEWGVLTGFDKDVAYAAIRKDAFSDRGTAYASSMYGRNDLSHYMSDGYVTAGKSDESVTESQGYWLADAAVAHAAQLLGKKDDAEVLSKRSLRYNTLFNKETGFFQPKGESGAFVAGFDPIAWKNGFTEASAWQYRFDVPHDVEGLNKLFDGKLCGKIGEMMHMTSGEYFHVGGYGSVIHEMQEAQKIQGDFGLYAHSNQPVHHILWIAKKAGCNEVGDVYLRKVMRKLYTRKGWSGDEDNGEMASWYVLAALGIFQLEGAKDEMVLGSPSIVKGTVDLPEGKTFAVLTENQSDENVHVQKVTWAPTGGKKREVPDNLMKYTELMRGGTLTFTMGSSPKAEKGFLSSIF